MRIIARSTLLRFWAANQDAEQPLKSWFAETKKAKWESPHHVKSLYRTASILGNNKVVFNIAGNKYRLVVKVHYKAQVIFIRFIGTHREYNRIDAEAV